ncbi:tyrosine-type recombinase/integrase [Variovorax humicola]|uniref:Tyrosine-type recombinase/integrase n=1 Tax=Variovorax humicola TaxID=1769758 RepID=A0ABU8W337_9BURK
MGKQISPSFASLVQEFFTDYMTRQRSLSPQTVASYRDSFLLLLRFAEQALGKPAAAVELQDLRPKFIASFLDHLERDRGNSPRSRNIRLAALRSFLKFAARRDIANLSVIEQALAVPMKRFDRKMVGFLTREQMLAVIDVPTATWLGQRDHLLLMLMFNTGARVSELISIRVEDVILGSTSSVRLKGKGRKHRSLPLWKTTSREVRDWLRLNPHLEVRSALLPRRDGEPMTRANVAQRLKRAVVAASAEHPELGKLAVSPHLVRHSTAMGLLQAGTNATDIALWLGHESPSTTHMYVEADLAMKERTLARLKPPEAKLPRYRPPKGLMQFLKSL